MTVLLPSRAPAAPHDEGHATDGASPEEVGAVGSEGVAGSTGVAGDRLRR